jgi:glycosyltransferase involved in cell wall biosynthesis
MPKRSKLCMKIVHTCNRYYPYFGGLEAHVQNISEKMVKFGHEVYVYTTDPSGKLPSTEMLNGVMIYRFKSFAPRDSYFFSTELYRGLTRTSCDIIHGHDLNGFPLLAGALAKRSRKFIATLHVGAFSSYFRTLMRIPYDRVIMHTFLARANRIICVSEYERRIYERILRLPSNKFIVIPNGYDLSVNEHKNSTKEGRTILSVGRLEKAKGFHHLLQSFAFINKDKEFDDVQLIIVGKGPYESHLRKLISKLGLTGRVHMFQDVPRSKLLELYAQCEAFVLLSNYESSGLAVMDAFALQKPTITSTEAVLGEYARRGFSVGVAFPSRAEGLAIQIENVLRNPSKYKPKRFEMLSWTDVANRTLAVYNKALNE